VLLSLKKYAPDDWYGYLEPALISEQYYYVLLWNGLYKEALEYANKMVERMIFLAAPKSKWLERAGDTLFFMDDYFSARQFYFKGLKDLKPINSYNERGLYLKLSDVHFLLGQPYEERFYREKIYGSLHH